MRAATWPREARRVEVVELLPTRWQDEPMRAGRARLVGRSAELRELREALAASRRGAARVVVVSGDAGIGKTRLLREFAEDVDPDVLVVTGQCVDSGVGPLPQAAIIGLVSALVDAVGVDAVRGAAGAAADALGL